MAEGLLTPQDVFLDACTIVTALNQPFDFSKMVVEINYFEDIYNNCITGSLVLNDSSGMLNVLGFSGNDYLLLSFRKPGNEYERIKKTFRIFSVSNRTINKEQNETYILNFCSEENVLSEQYKISKSYKNKKVSDIVKDIIINQLLVRPEKFPNDNLEETKGLRDIIIPNYKPFQALNWLATQAISNDPNSTGSPYLFFENLYGYNFKSLQSLYGGKVYKTYKFEPKNLNLPEDNRVQDLNAELTNVLSVETLSNFDSLNSINTGAFANRLIAVDTVRQNYTINDFDIQKYWSNGNHLNSPPPVTNSINRKGDSVNTTYNSVLKVATTNTGQSTFNKYIKSHDPSIKDINVETRIPYRTAQIAQLNTVRYKITVPGDPSLTVGTVIEFMLPELRTMPDGDRIWDIYYSGNFLITAVRHKIDQENKYLTIMEISKESLRAPYFNFNNELPSWKEVRGR